MTRPLKYILHCVFGFAVFAFTLLLPFYLRLNRWAYQDFSNTMSIGPERQQGYEGMNVSLLHVP